jgi:hypothetical protein
MLRKPGEYDPNRSVRPQVSNRRKTQEGPDDIVRKLQRLPVNKKCADCSARVSVKTHGGGDFISFVLLVMRVFK